jgi:hypothetical protein
MIVKSLLAASAKAVVAQFAIDPMVLRRLTAFGTKKNLSHGGPER